MVCMGRRREMATVVTELLNTVYSVSLKKPKRFESRKFLRLQVEWKEWRICFLIPSLKGEKK